MPRFYLHLSDGWAFIQDEEGGDYADLAAARAGAIYGLRDALAADLIAGEINIDAFIRIEDSECRLVDTVRFADAVKIVTDSACGPRGAG